MKKIKKLFQIGGISLGLITGSLMLGINSLTPVKAFFFDQTYIQNNVIRMGDWTPPTSSDDITHLLPAFVNNQNFEVYVTASDDYSKVVEVRLYYSYGNLNNFQFELFDTLKSNQGDFVADNNVNVSFNFRALKGDGHYDLAVVAVDEFGNQESLPVVGGAASNLISVDVDTTPPVTALSLPESGSQRFLSADQEIHGSFEVGDITGFNFGGEDPNDQQVINDPSKAHQGEGAFQLGNEVDARIDTNFLSKNYLLTTPSWLSFFWRYVSEDYIDFDYFRVTATSQTKTVNILWYGLDVNDPPYDTDWMETSYFFDQSWVGEGFNLRFELKNSLDADYPSYVVIDDIRFIPQDNHFIAASADLNILSKDASGSGVKKINVCVDNNCTVYDPDPVNDTVTIAPLPVGEIEIKYWGEDDLGNQEATKTARLKVKDDSGNGMIEVGEAEFNKNIVLNQFLADPDPNLGQGNDSDNMPLGEWIELFNRHPNLAIDVNGWYIEDQAGNVIVLDSSRNPDNLSVVEPLGKRVFYLNKAMLNNNGDEIKLYDASGVLIDKVIYDQVVTGKSWKREPDGFGSWMDPKVTIATTSGRLQLNLNPTLKEASRSSEFKTTLSASSSGQVRVETKITSVPTPTPSVFITPTLVRDLTPTPTNDQLDKESLTPTLTSVTPTPSLANEDTLSKTASESGEKK